MLTVVRGLKIGQDEGEKFSAVHDKKAVTFISYLSHLNLKFYLGFYNALGIFSSKIKTLSQR